MFFYTFYFISSGTSAHYKDRTVFNLTFFFSFLAFSVLSSLFWGTTSFQLIKNVNDIRSVLMRAPVMKTLHSAIKIIQYFSGGKLNKIHPSSQHNWSPSFPLPCTFLLWFSETLQSKISCLFVFISENEKDLYQVGNTSNCPFWLVNEILLMYKKHLFTTLIVTLQVDFIWLETHLFQWETNLFCGIHRKDLNLKINKMNCLPAHR